MAKKPATSTPVTLADESSESARDEFSDGTRQLLARRAGFRCSICQTPTTGPHSEAGRAIYLGEACHIHSAAVNGPRANPALASEERKAPSNGIHLCKVHAKLIDVDVNEFPAAKLIELKNAHEVGIRALIHGPSNDFDGDFLTNHESQVIHSRGAPSLSDLWVPRQVIQAQANQTVLKRDPIEMPATESGIILISSEQWTGRTSLLKRVAAKYLGQRNCVWLDGRELTERSLKEPIECLAQGYQKINSHGDGWQQFLDGPATKNLVLIDNLHLSRLNIAARRRFLILLRGLSHSVMATVDSAFALEIQAASTNDGLRVGQWALLDLPRVECESLVERWCRYRAESVPDHELDSQIVSTTENIEILFGKKLMPRQPLFILTTLQMMDAGSPTDTAVGSFGGVYESVIHLAIAKNAPNQAEISSERAYLEELANWCESQPDATDRQAFNTWFADRKTIRIEKVADLEASLLAKGFLARRHCGFRFNYQKYYFQASFLRTYPNRPGAKEYISKLIANCWNEDYANIALFLAYLQPSSFLLEALLAEIQKTFANQEEFKIADWHVEELRFPKNFFQGVELTNDPEANRRKLAERLDETDPVNSSECEIASPPPVSPQDQIFLDLPKSFHLIKLVGQLIRNSPVALDGDPKKTLVLNALNLSLRVSNFMSEICNPIALRSQALNAIRDLALQHADKVKLEAELAGIVYHIYVILVFGPMRHACSYLAHPDLGLVYRDVLKLDSSDKKLLSYRVLAAGLFFSLRTPNTQLLKNVYRDLPPAGQHLLRVWTYLFLSFNRVPVPKKQAILQCVDLESKTQLLLPSGLD